MGKRKHKANQTTPRKCIYSIPVSIDKPQTVHFEMLNGEFRLYDENHNPIDTGNSELMLTRERASSARKGDKVILKMPISLRENNTFIEDYDSIYAIDTNSKIYNNLFFSESAFAKLLSIRQEGGETVAKISVDRFLTVYDRREEHKEQKMWLLAIKAIIDQESDDARTALAVDCDLGKINEYNQRTIKIADQEYLPNSITLIYATSDNHDTIFNYMVAQCDAIAKKNLKNRLEEVMPHDQL